MSSPTHDCPHEGVWHEDAGKRSAEGFIMPSIGALRQALYFTTVPSLIEKTQQILKQHRLVLPGAVIVWDETIGRRKGAKAVPKGWWATNGSLTVAFAFPPRTDIEQEEWLTRGAASVLRVIKSFNPCSPASFRAPNDLVLDDRKIGAVLVKQHHHADIVIVRLNCTTDFSKAPAEIKAIACRLIDFIDPRQLPMQREGALANSFLTRLMTELPLEFDAA